MRNGLNIAGVSELVHEVEASADEAQYRYAASAAWRPGRGTTGRSEPALLGSVKSPRRFTFTIADHPTVDPGAGVADPVRLALTALGSCALTTLIAGASARGVTFEHLRLHLSAYHRRRWGARWLSDLTYTIESRAAVNGVDLGEVVEFVVQQSPNHRTVIDPQALTLSLGGEPETVEGIRIPAAPIAGHTVEQHIEWSYGVQFRAPIDGTELRIDQAKQMGGVDWGPNPQEYMLMALAACVVQRLAEIVAEEGLPPLVWQARASGRVDVRGLLMTEPGIPPQVQDLHLTVDEPEGAPEDWRDLVREAVRRSAVAGLLTQPHRIKLNLESETFDAASESVAPVAAESAEADAVPATPETTAEITDPAESVADQAESGLTENPDSAGVPEPEIAESAVVAMSETTGYGEVSALDTVEPAESRYAALEAGARHD
ncbi:OsmC family protein [Micromonospora sp. NPDC047134]|uniref:OsmC family protein n=1 Tax=Micromonospora sp. NPDC047134 TaxID=3154340 RepID=UPI00340BDE06